jgi:hypothetical protein
MGPRLRFVETAKGGIKMKTIRLFSIVSILLIFVPSSIALAQDLSETRPRRVHPVTQVSDQYANRLALRTSDDSTEPGLGVAASWVRIAKVDPGMSVRRAIPTAVLNKNPALPSPKLDAPIIDKFIRWSSSDISGKPVSHMRIEGRAAAGDTVLIFFDDNSDETKPDRTVTASKSGIYLSLSDGTAERVRARVKVGNDLSEFSEFVELTDPTKAFLVGLAPFGIALSQQSEQFSQSDPFGGFIVGNVVPIGPYKPDFGRTRSSFNLRFQVLMQPEARTAMAMETEGDSSTPDITFLSSRKSLDVEGHLWWEIAANSVFSFGPYGAIGGATVLNKNEVVGEDVSVGQGEARKQLDTTRLITTNDMKKYYEYGMLMDFYGGRTGDADLYIQAILAKGWYEALANQVTTNHDTRQRFIGKLRVFPFGLNRNFLARGTVTPMFGVDLNAGRGQDHLRIFVGMVLNVAQFINKAKEALP